MGSIELRIEAAGHPVRVALNEGLLAVTDGSLHFEHRVDVDEWLLPEGNRLRLEVGEARERPTALKVVLRPTQVTAPETLHVEFSVPEDGQAGPWEVELPFSPPVPVPTLAWQEARRFDAATFDEEARAGAVAAGLALVEALAEKDAGKVAELLRYRLAESARANPEEDEGFARYRWLMSRDPLQLVPVSPADVAPKVVWGGRLVLLSRGGRPLVETAPHRFLPIERLDVFVAFIDAAWRVVR